MKSWQSYYTHHYDSVNIYFRFQIGVLRQLVGSHYFALPLQHVVIVLCKISRLYEEKDEK